MQRYRIANCLRSCQFYFLISIMYKLCNGVGYVAITTSDALEWTLHDLTLESVAVDLIAKDSISLYFIFSSISLITKTYGRAHLMVYTPAYGKEEHQTPYIQ